MTSLWTVILSLAQNTPDPEDVKPGWLALGIFLLMGLAVVGLAFSLVKHLRRTRANFEERDADSDPPT
ncbi:MAG TPA: hypothetical protein VFD59_08150 [Nocardioidaceae bacterium]|nr:hypothetical protein [Nocardioidaceae bacterium]